MPDQIDDSDLMIQPDEIGISVVPRDDLDLLVLNGDLAVQSGPDNLRASMIRRLRTPLGYFGIMVMTFDDNTGEVLVLRVGADYGSSLGNNLSEPMTNDWIRSVVQAIQTALGQEPLVTISDISADILDPIMGKVKFVVSYDVAGVTGTTGNLTLNLGQGGLAVGA